MSTACCSRLFGLGYAGGADPRGQDSREWVRDFGAGVDVILLRRFRFKCRPAGD